MNFNLHLFSNLTVNVESNTTELQQNMTSQQVSDDVTNISQSQFPDLSGEFFCVKPVQNVGICEMIVFCDPEYDSELVHPPRVQRVLLILDQPPRVGPVGCCGEDEGF